MGSAVVVDTNVISYLFSSHSLGEPYMAYLQDKSLAMSFISVGEVLAGAAGRSWGPKRLHFLEGFLSDYTVLQSSLAVCEHYAWTLENLRRLGRPTATNDIWIAATALAYGMPLVTHNRRHFERIPGLELVSFAP